MALECLGSTGGRNCELALSYRELVAPFPPVKALAYFSMVLLPLARPRVGAIPITEVCGRDLKLGDSSSALGTSSMGPSDPWSELW